MKISSLGLCAVFAASMVSFHAQAGHHDHGHNLPVSAEDQAKLTPDKVLQELKAGNERYRASELTDPNVVARIKAATKGQYPMAYVLSCVDSRVPVELIFDQGIGDIFVGRNAGNIENEDQLGSMEFASAVAGVKLVVVMGHEACGAVKGACDDVKLGNLTMLLEKIAPSVRAVDGYAAGERNSKNVDFVKDVTLENVRRTVADLRARSSVLAELEKEGKLKIVGAYYALEDGSVQFL